MRKILKSITALVILFFISTALVLPVYADELDDLKTVRVSCGMNDALYLDEEGRAQGICSEYLSMLAYVNNWKLEYVEGSWNESVQNLYDGKIDILFPTQKTLERQGNMAFSEYIGGYQPIILIARQEDDIFYNDYVSMDGKKVAVSGGTSNEQQLNSFCEEHAISLQITTLNTIEEKLQALEDGTVDLISISSFNTIPDGKVVANLEYLPFYYCTTPENTELMAELNSGMKQIMSIKPDMVTNLFGDVLKGNTPVAYTKEENEVIQNTDHITVGVYEDSLPLAGVDGQGETVGIYIDILKELEEKTGITVVVKEIPREKYLYDCLDDGSVDFVMGTKSLAYLSDHISSYLVTESLISYVTDAVTMPNYEFDNSKPTTVVLTNARKYLEASILETNPLTAFIYVDNAKECLMALQNGDADITYMNSWEYNYQSKNPRFQNMIEWSSVHFESSIVLGALRSTDEQLLSVIDKAVTQIASEDKDQIITGNLNMSYAALSFQERWYSIRYAVYAFVAIFLIGVISVIVYMCMRKSYIRQLQENNQKLVEANEAKDMFLSRMSHELRTPLNAINGYAVVLKQDQDAGVYDEQKVRNSLDSILRASQYQLAIISDLLDIHQIESGKLELVPVEVDSKRYMDNIVDMITLEAKEKNIDFTYTRLSTVNETYYLDGVRFQQVLLNILHNAMKFTPNGGKVTMTAEVIDQDENSNTLKFVIADNGVGMSEDFQKNYLFHRFAQEYKGNKSPYAGCGTGLAISRDIVHLMGGEITCKSTLGAGSTFTVIITAKHIDRKAIEKKAPEKRDLTGIRVLLCEDNAMNQDMEKRLLQRMNCEVEIANDGVEGLEKFNHSAENYYSVVLMDIRMPNMDGLECTRQIRALERVDANTVPIMAVSANAFAEDIEKSLEAGMNEHLAKPVDVKILYEKIKEYCITTQPEEGDL